MAHVAGNLEKLLYIQNTQSGYLKYPVTNNTKKRTTVVDRLALDRDR